jgi:uncharacterized membrane protein YphA (DoxX/SURF4 family)
VTRVTSGRRRDSDVLEEHMLDPRLHGTWRTLEIFYGVVPIVAGLDKFTNLLTRWDQYLSPLALRIVPVSAPTFMHVVGIIEIVAGILVLSRYTRVGAYVVSAWLVAIALSLITSGRFLDVAVRDLGMALGAFTLARLTEARTEARTPAPARTRGLEPSRAGA